MTRIKAQFALPLLFTAMMGCRTDAPKTPATEPKATVSPRPTNEHPDPKNQDCDAISDPAQAENCRLWKGVEAARKKHNSDPAVKHSPGSIQQP